MYEINSKSPMISNHLINLLCQKQSFQAAYTWIYDSGLGTMFRWGKDILSNHLPQTPWLFALRFFKKNITLPCTRISRDGNTEDAYRIKIYFEQKHAFILSPWKMGTLVWRGLSVFLYPRSEIEFMIVCLVQPARFIWPNSRTRNNSSSLISNLSSG